jgi:hypothetical protein
MSCICNRQRSMVRNIRNMLRMEATEQKSAH